MVKIKTVEYTMLVEQWGGEGQLIIIATVGQSGHLALRVLQTGVDGGSSSWPEGNNGVNEICYYPYGKLRVEDAATVLRKHLEEDPHMQNVDAIVKAFIRHWQLQEAEERGKAETKRVK